MVDKISSDLKLFLSSDFCSDRTVSHFTEMRHIDSRLSVCVLVFTCMFMYRHNNKLKSFFCTGLICAGGGRLTMGQTRSSETDLRVSVSAPASELVEQTVNRHTCPVHIMV